MYMQKLKIILPPPAKPLENDSHEAWRDVEKVLGTVLPKDYKDFVNTYGTGAVDNFLWVLNPFTENKYLHLIKKGKVMSDAYISSKRQFPEDFIHKVYSEPGGLLAWGATDNGDELFWLTEGEPDNWPVIVYPSRQANFFVYAMPVAEFIYKVINREITCPAFPDDFLNLRPEFISAEAD